tara:strand:- start:170 stop:388 length:219 start_codon:yes stop_codon:yes gene_type:complete
MRVIDYTNENKISEAKVTIAETEGTLSHLANSTYLTVEEMRETCKRLAEQLNESRAKIHNALHGEPTSMDGE